MVTGLKQLDNVVAATGNQRDMIIVMILICRRRIERRPRFKISQYWVRHGHTRNRNRQAGLRNNSDG